MARSDSNPTAAQEHQRPAMPGVPEVQDAPLKQSGPAPTPTPAAEQAMAAAAAAQAQARTVRPAPARTSRKTPSDASSGPVSHGVSKAGAESVSVSGPAPAPAESTRTRSEAARAPSEATPNRSEPAPTAHAPALFPSQQTRALTRTSSRTAAVALHAPSLALLAQAQGVSVEALEAQIVCVREAWHRGDQSAIADALLSQAALLEATAASLLRNAGAAKNLKTIEAYTHLALRAYEQARKTLGTLAGMRAGPRHQTNIQVNVGEESKEVLSGDVHDA